MFRPIALTISTICCVFYMSSGQSFQTFANASWNSVSSENFDVFYTGKNRSGAKLTAKYAELARYELGVLFDFKPEFRYPIVYGGNQGEIDFGNFEDNEQKKFPGIFNMPDLRGLVIHPGTARGLYENTKKQVASLIINEFTYGDRIGNIMQTHLLYHHARWYHEGLAEYVAHGWTYEDETWINSIRATEENVVQLALEGSGKINQVIRKSIWRYIALDYGESKLSEILYLSSIQHSIESGIISVLGINLNTLTLRWREYINSQSDIQVEGKELLDQLPNAKSIDFPKSQRLVAFSHNVSKGLLAVMLEKNGKHNVSLYDLENETFKDIGIQSGHAHQRPFEEFHIPLAWSKDGQQLITPVYTRKGYQLASYDMEEELVSYLPVPNDIQQITHISWSHDAKKLALSALHGGQIDLYTVQLSSPDFRQITDDLYDDLDPSWSLDNSALIFSSNRLEGAPLDLEIYQDNFDLFLWTYENSSAKISRLTNTPDINERQPEYYRGSEAYFLTDQSGIHNLASIQTSNKKVQIISNLEQGIQAFEINETSISFSTPVSGKELIFVTPLSSLNHKSKPESTLYRLEYQSKFQDRLREAPKPVEDVIVNVEEPKEEDEPKEAEEEEKDRNVKYYIFDEDDVPYESKKANKKDLVRKKKKNKLVQTVFGDIPKPKLMEVEVDESRVKSPWAADHLGFGLIWDPLPHNFKYGLDLQVGYSDLLKNHKLDIRVRPFLNLKNTFADIRYEYKKKKIDLFAEGTLRARTFRETSPINNDTSFFRYDRVSLKAGGRLPINSVSAFSVFVGGNYLTRNDQKLLRTENLDRSDILAQAGALLEFDNVKEEEGFEYYGTRAKAGFNSYYSFKNNEFTFHNIHAKVSHYQPIYNKIVFASQISASFNLPNTATQFYLGSIENQVALVEFANNDGQPVRNNSVDTSLYNFGFLEFVMPMRGFYPNTRQGSRYIVGNFELRIPITRLLRHTLNTNSMYSFEIIPFLDAGTVWVDGNPFSQKKPTDTQFISTGNISVKLQTLKSPFLIGFGTGLRTNILSYSLRTDIAWGLDDGNLQRPVLTVSLGKNF